MMVADAGAQVSGNGVALGVGVSVGLGVAVNVAVGFGVNVAKTECTIT